MLKQKTKIRLGLASFVAVLVAVLSCFKPVVATESSTNFEVNVQESLAVTITVPDGGVTGNMNTFLRNAVEIDVFSNNSAGFTTTMAAKTNTYLSHTSLDNTTIPSLTNTYTRSGFPSNYWGYSINDTSAGNESSSYLAIPASGSPVTINELSSNGAGTGNETIYFGTKVDGTKPSGTYSGTILIAVVAGADTSTPSTDADTSESNPNASYSSSTDRTVYTSITTDDSTGTKTTTTVVSEGDTRATYEDPQGVNTVASISNSSSLATGLAVTASVAAASGIFFFILAKRDDDDDEDEENA